MPQYLITGPDGKKYKVTGPSAQGALDALKRQFDGGGSSAPNMSLGVDADIGAMTPDVAVGNRAQREYDQLPGWAKPIVAANDLVGLAANGLTFGFGDKGLAKFDELVGRGTYEDRLAQRRQETEDARTRSGLAGTVAEIGGSVIPAAKAAQLGVTATRLPGWFGRLGGMAIDGAGYGALSAAGNDQDIGTGAGIGAAFGAGGQAAANVIGTVAKPVMSRLRPEKAAQEVMLKAMDEAGTNPQAIAMDLAKARADGQDVYAVMDAMGYPGQRLASTVVRTPNEGRSPMVEFLERRQAGQGRRVSNALAEGFGDPATALQKVKALEDARRTGGDINYTAARNEAGNVNLTTVLNNIDQKIGKPFAGVDDGIDENSIGGALLKVRRMLAGKNGAQKMDFPSLLNVRSDISDMVFSSPPKRAGALKSVLTDLDAALADASKGYRKALEQYAKDSKVINAVQTGRTAAMRGRYEDTIPAYRAMTPEEQAAFRPAYADPLIEQAQSAAVGVNKVRPLINDAFEQEFAAFAAPGRGEQLGRRIAREKTMFDTLNEALRGSKTANNLADEADLSVIDPSIIGNVLSGNLTGAAKNALLQGMSALKGQPPAVRALLADALRVTDPNVALANLNRAVSRIKASQQQKQAIVRSLMFLGTAGSLQSQR